nr:MAG TPA_asm: helix-turn-helix domain protein [Caudoviricetes sp.]
MAENFRYSVRYWRLEQGLTLSSLCVFDTNLRKLRYQADVPIIILSELDYLTIRDALKIPVKTLVKRPPECIPFLYPTNRRLIFEKLEEIRKAKGLTMKQINIAMGDATGSKWSQIINKGAAPNDVTLYKACKALDVKLSDLATEVKNEQQGIS